jgi:hypothetical protein
MAEQNARQRAKLLAALSYLTDTQCAAICDCDVKTWKNRRSRGDAAPSSKVGRDHLTKVDDLQKWIASRRASRV